jgi:tetratricopeptide (TPR) repeat protein
VLVVWSAGATAGGAAQTATVNVARALLDAGDADGAARAAREVLAATPGEPAAAAILGLALHRTGAYAEALAAFEIALASAPPEKRASLRFNAAVCLDALDRQAEAEVAFLEVAQAGGALVAQAFVEAGFAALARGALESAVAHAAAARRSPGHEAARADLEALDGEVEARRREQVAAEVDAALEALARDDPRAAEAAYTRALEIGATTPDAGRAELLYGLGMALYRQRRYDEAQRRFDAARAQRPDDGEIAFMAAACAQARGAHDDATRGLGEALDLGLGADVAAAATARLTALAEARRPAADDERGRARAAGVTVTAVAGGGYESNAAGTGTDGEPALRAVGAGVGSATGRLSLRAGYEHALAADLEIGADYDFDQLLLFGGAVQELSLHQHVLEVTLRHDVAEGLTWTTGAHAALTVDGLRHLAPHSWKAGTTLGVEWLVPDGEAQTWLEVKAGRRGGLRGAGYLDGWRLGASAGETLYGEAWWFGVDVRARYDGAGAQVLSLDGESLAVCGLVCEGARYVIPLAWWGPGVGVWAGVSLPHDVTLVAGVDLEWRRYIGAARVSPAGGGVIAGSAKRRRDRRIEMTAEVGWQPWESVRVAVRVAPLWSASNLTGDAADPEHAWDYDDVEFDAQQVGLEVTWRWP